MENRQPRLERAEEAVQSIIAAATSELIEQGLDSITHRRVAERANANLRSTTYYFKSVKALRREALKVAFSLSNRKREAMLAEPQELVKGALAELVLTFTYGSKPSMKQLVVTQQNVLMAASDPDYADIMQEVQVDTEEHVSRLLALFGSNRSAREVIITLDGLIFEHILSGGKTDYVSTLKEYLKNE